MKKESPVPRLAIVHDHPANWTGGGTLLLKRLFEDYPNQLHYVSAFPGSEAMRGWAPYEFATDTQANMGRFGVGRMRLISSLFPLSRRTRKLREYFAHHKIQVVHAVAHEYLWIPALWAAKSLKIQYVLAVHDHWPSTVRRQIPPALAGLIFKFCARSAKDIIGSHPEMADILLRETGLRQAAYEMDGLTATELETATRSQSKPCQTDVFTIGYSGMYRTYREEFKVLQSAIRKIAATGQKVKIVIYSDLTKSELEAEGWRPEEFCSETWISYDQVVQRLALCDACFLPMSFRVANQKAMQWGIPGKTPQYVKAGKPIIVFAPSYSSIAKLATKANFGYVASENSADALIHAIRKALLSEKSKTNNLYQNLPDCLRFDSVKKTIWTTIRNASSRE